MTTVNPFKWVSEVFDTIGELQEAAVVLYCAGALIVCIFTHAYEEVASLVVFAAVGLIAAIPGSLVISAILELLSNLFESILER